MAKALNRTRIRDTRLLLLLAVLVTMLMRPTFAPSSTWATCLEMLGELLIAACALGRVYTTAFLGGHKNTQLIDHGPFSVVRNPLYACSLTGVAGVAVMSGNAIVMLLLPAAFYGLFSALVAREEARLVEIFGDDYRAYCASTPRFLPDFRRFRTEAVMQVNPALLWNAVRDAALWFFALPLFELVGHAKAVGWLPNWSLF